MNNQLGRPFGFLGFKVHGGNDKTRAFSKGSSKFVFSKCVQHQSPEPHKSVEYVCTNAQGNPQCCKARIYELVTTNQNDTVIFSGLIRMEHEHSEICLYKNVGSKKTVHNRINVKKGVVARFIQSGQRFDWEARVVIDPDNPPKELEICEFKFVNSNALGYKCSEQSRSNRLTVRKDGKIYTPQHVRQYYHGNQLSNGFAYLSRECSINGCRAKIWELLKIDPSCKKEFVTSFYFHEENLKHTCCGSPHTPLTPPPPPLNPIPNLFQTVNLMNLTYMTCYPERGTMKGGDLLTVYARVVDVKFLTPLFCNTILVKIGERWCKPYIQAVGKNTGISGERRMLHLMSNVECIVRTEANNIPDVVPVGVGVVVGSTCVCFNSKKLQYEFVDEEKKKSLEEQEVDPFIIDEDMDMDVDGIGNIDFDLGDPNLIFDDLDDGITPETEGIDDDFFDVFKKYKVDEKLGRNNYGQDKICYAIALGMTVDFIKKELEKGDVNAIDNFGNSYLHWANYYKREKIVKYLLNNTEINVKLDNHFGYQYTEWSKGLKLGEIVKQKPLHPNGIGFWEVLMSSVIIALSLPAQNEISGVGKKDVDVGYTRQKIFNALYDISSGIKGIAKEAPEVIVAARFLAYLSIHKKMNDEKKEFFKKITLDPKKWLESKDENGLLEGVKDMKIMKMIEKAQSDVKEMTFGYDRNKIYFQTIKLSEKCVMIDEELPPFVAIDDMVRKFKNLEHALKRFDKAQEMLVELEKLKIGEEEKYGPCSDTDMLKVLKYKFAGNRFFHLSDVDEFKEIDGDKVKEVIGSLEMYISRKKSELDPYKKLVFPGMATYFYNLSLSAQYAIIMSQCYMVFKTEVKVEKPSKKSVLHQLFGQTVEYFRKSWGNVVNTMYKTIVPKWICVRSKKVDECGRIEFEGQEGKGDAYHDNFYAHTAYESTLKGLFKKSYYEQLLYVAKILKILSENDTIIELEKKIHYQYKEFKRLVEGPDLDHNDPNFGNKDANYGHKLTSVLNARVMKERDYRIILKEVKKRIKEDISNLTPEELVRLDRELMAVVKFFWYVGRIYQIRSLLDDLTLVMIVGPQKAGKTKFLQECFDLSSERSTGVNTIDPIMHKFTPGVYFVDLPAYDDNSAKRSNLQKVFLKFAKAVVVIVPLEEATTEGCVEMYKHICQLGVPFWILLNKTDLFHKTVREKKTRDMEAKKKRSRKKTKKKRNNIFFTKEKSVVVKLEKEEFMQSVQRQVLNLCSNASNLTEEEKKLIKNRISCTCLDVDGFQLQMKYGIENLVWVGENDEDLDLGMVENIPRDVLCLYQGATAIVGVLLGEVDKMLKTNLREIYVKEVEGENDAVV